MFLSNITVPQPDDHRVSTQHSNNLKSCIIVTVICTKTENVVTVNTTYCNQKEVVTNSKQACKKNTTQANILIQKVRCEELEGVVDLSSWCVYKIKISTSNSLCGLRIPSEMKSFKPKKQAGQFCLQCAQVCMRRPPIGMMIPDAVKCNFDLLMMSTCSKHVEAWNKTYCKTKILWIKLVNYWDKYTEMQGQ